MYLPLALILAADGATPMVHIAGEARPDPHRWLEDTDAPAVQAWWAERDAEARAWIAEDGRAEAFADWHRAWSTKAPPERTLLAARGDVRLSRVWVDGRDTLLLSTPDGERALTADLDDTHGLCAAVTLDRAARAVAWGRWTDTTQGACRLYVADVAPGDGAVASGAPVFEGARVGASFSPDAQRLLITHVAGGRGRATVVGRAGEVYGEPLTSQYELAAAWLADGHVFAMDHARVRGGTTDGGRLAWGTVDDLRRLGNALFWPSSDDYRLVGADGDDLLLRTTIGAPMGQVVRVDARRPWKARWQVAVPEDPHTRLVAARQLGDHVLTVRQGDGVYRLEAHALAGPADAVLLGSASDSIVLRGGADSAFVTLTTLDARRIVSIGPDLSVRELHADPARLGFTTEYVISEDGTEVPVSVVRPAGVADDAPVWLEVYGGSGSGHSVAYQEQARLWTALGGIFAIAHVRGGDERGAAWYEAVRREHAERTVDDVLAVAASFRPRSVVLTGTSHGGFVAGAAVARRPDLFAAVVASLGLYDLVRAGVFEPGDRFDRFGGRRHGPLREQRARLALSAVHATPPGPLPPILLVTGREDHNVPPEHSFKLAAAWRDLPGGPVLLRVDPWVTHGHRADIEARGVESFHQEWAWTMAFVVRALGLDWAPPVP